MKYRILAILLTATISLATMAQELRTSYFMQTSNYRHEMNPALLDSSYIAMPLLLGNFNLGLTGNMGLTNFIYKMQPSWQGYGVDGRNLTTFMHPNVDASTFLNKLNNQNDLALHLKYQLAGVAFKAFGGMNVVELNLCSNTSLSLPKSLFEFMKTTGEKPDYQIKNLGMRTENYLELGLGHSRKVGEKLTVGGKFKLLIGAAYSDLNVETLNLHLRDDYWLVDGDARLSAAIMNSTLSYEDPSKNYVDEHGNLTNRRRIDGIDEFKPGLSGWGLAIDLGATYQLLPDLKLSAAITDLGFINWSNAYQASSAGVWRFEGFENDIYASGTDTGNNKIEDQLDAIQDGLKDMFALYEDETPQKSDARTLAATLNAGAEYTLPVYRKLRLGFLYSGRMAGKFSHHQGMFTATVRPLKWFEAAVNVAAGSTGVTGGMVIDFHARHFNIFVGTDRFFGKVSKQFIPLNNTNANVSLGMSVPL